MLLLLARFVLDRFSSVLKAAPLGGRVARVLFLEIPVTLWGHSWPEIIKVDARL